MTRILFVAFVLLLAACSGGSADSETSAGESQSSTESPVESASESSQAEALETTTSTTAPSDTTPPTSAAPASTPATTAPTLQDPVQLAANGRAVPVAPTSAEDAAAKYTAVYAGLRAEGSTQEDWADLGHSEQVIVRTMIRNPEWEADFLAALDPELAQIAGLHLDARRELGLLHAGGPAPSERVPAWRVIDPVPLDQLVAWYQSAGEQTGIDWRILAGINLVETGMGRIDGVSTAGAQGPMQFLPTTWEEVSQGGDIRDPDDAIHGAARYLVQRGGLEDIQEGLWGYNNSFNYGNAVLAYAQIIELDERNLRGFYNWEVYVGSSEGILWLPVGYEEPEPRQADDYVANNPWVTTIG